MRNLIALLLVCIATHAEARHTLRFYFLSYTGVPNFPEFVCGSELDDTLLGYCNTSKRIVEGKVDWLKKLLQEDQHFLKSYQITCFEELPVLYKHYLKNVMDAGGINGGAHIIQVMSGCEMDENTKDFSSFYRFGFDGEDLLIMDMDKLTWIPQNDQAVSVKHLWEPENKIFKEQGNFYSLVCPVWLSAILKESMSHPKPVLPSVSLLQKTPSSQVSCHATGFYPDRAVLFWRRGEDEIHEGVEHGDILRNHDGTFQMTVELNVSLIPPEDWREYDCVFQLYGFSEDIRTTLDKTRIRTNWKESNNMIVPIASSLAFVVLVIFAITAYIAFKKKKGTFSTAYSDNSAELSESLNPET